MTGLSKTIFLIHYESCECKYGLKESVCSSKQKCNHDESRCECVELNFFPIRYFMSILKNLQ